MLTLNNYLIEENKHNWEVVNKQIDLNKSFRFNYKKVLGVSLTEFITKREHLTNKEIEEEFFNNENIKNYLKLNPMVEKKLLECVKISISSRKAEHNTYNNRAMI